MDYIDVFVLYHKTTKPTGKAIALQMGAKYGTPRILQSKHAGKTVGTVIRWGSQTDLRSIVRSCHLEINSPAAMSKASDKLRSLRILQQEGVPVPPFSESLQELDYQHKVVLGRKKHGFGGKDIQILLPSSSPNTIGFYENIETTSPPSRISSEFYTEYIPNTREYRIHVFRDEVIRVQGKYLDYPEQHTNSYIKNYNQGFRFRAPDKELNASRKEAAIAAVKALGLDFGAVDLLIGEDRKEYVLEVNTAPSCSPLTQSAYVTKFQEIINA